MTTFLARDRLAALAGLILVAGLAWLYLWREAAMMSSAMPMDMPADAMAGSWSARNFLLTFVMWSVMMVAMMLPSAAPAILLYGSMVRRNAERGVPLAAAWIFALGYLAAWTMFSCFATVMQLSLHEQNLLNMHMESSNVWLGAAILVVAGVYQWLPAKHACLNKCRHPVQFFITRWRAGGIGALRMGWEHGWFCVGCCWAIMLVLFVAGVMNLLWVALIAGFVFVEKVLPANKVTSRIAGIGLVATGLALLLI